MASPYGPRPKGVAKRPKSQAQQREAQPGKAAAARAFKLAVCGTLASHVQAHHALEKSWLKDEAWRVGLRGEALWAAVYDPRIGIRLSVRDHERHTNRVRVIWHDELPLELRRYVHERWGLPGDLAVLREHPARPREHSGPDAGAR